MGPSYPPARGGAVGRRIKGGPLFFCYCYHYIFQLQEDVGRREQTPCAMYKQRIVRLKTENRPNFFPILFYDAFKYQRREGWVFRFFLTFLEPMTH